MKTCNYRLHFITMSAVLMLLASIPALSQDGIFKIDIGKLEKLQVQGRPLYYDKVFGLERITVINMVPRDNSDETSTDSEPNLAVDPDNLKHLVGSAFTPNPSGATNSAPVYVSTDGGNTWALRNIVPSGNGLTGDISLDFAREDNTLYTGILRGGSWLQQMVLRSANPFTGGMMTTLTDHNTESLDQPYVTATTFTDSGVNRDRVYIGFNEIDNILDWGGTGQTASAEYSLDARTAAAPAGFTAARIEARNTNQQDMPAIRFAATRCGVIYGIFYRWVSGDTPNAVCDITVVRDDHYASGAAPFTDLIDPGDGLAGRRVSTGRTVPAFPASLGNNRLVASNLSIAVSPTNTAEVYIAWADRVGANDYTLHVRRSTNSGEGWGTDLLTITDATNPALAVAENGVVGFLYQQLTGTTPNDRWETHIRRSSDGGVNWSDRILADTPANNPGPTLYPYLGDYLDLIAIGKTFYGVFSASNYPDRNNFPYGVKYQRNVNFTTHQLRNVADNASVDVSIDPFFFKISPPTLIDICDLIPRWCNPPVFEPGRIVFEFEEFPFRAVDPVPKNCLLKWQCPGCEGRALCPPYYHIFIDNIDPRSWKVQIYGKQGEYVKQQVNHYKDGIVLSFRPSKEYYIENKIGDYYIGFESIGKHASNKYSFPTRLEVSDYPYDQHMRTRGMQ